jgi:hypothetical protein
MTFPIPYISAYTGIGEWELLSNTDTYTYPTGLQTGDIAIFLQASDRTGVTLPSNPPIPTGATELDIISRTTTTVPDMITIFHRGTSRISYKALTSADSGGTVATSTAQDRIRVLIFRCTVPASSPAVDKVDSSGTSATFSSTVDFIGAGYEPPFPAIYSLRVRDNNTIDDWTTTFDTVTQTAFESPIPSRSYFGVRTRINFRLADASLSNVAISVGSTQASQHLHQPYTLRKL